MRDSGNEVGNLEGIEITVTPQIGILFTTLPLKNRNKIKFCRVCRQLSLFSQTLEPESQTLKTQTNMAANLLDCVFHYNSWTHRKRLHLRLDQTCGEGIGPFEPSCLCNRMKANMHLNLHGNHGCLFPVGALFWIKENRWCSCPMRVAFPTGHYAPIEWTPSHMTAGVCLDLQWYFKLVAVVSPTLNPQ